ncbi:MAG: hypothetical protein ACREI8_09380 [Myxococcota bacterium]
MRAVRGLFGFVALPALALWAVLSVDLPQPLAAEAYTDGVTSLFLDRPYVNTERNAGLAGHRVVRLPRHLRFDVELRVSEPAQLVRFLSDENDNRVFGDWQPADSLRVTVPGRSCVLTRAVTRQIGPGSVRLPAGGPVSSAPLLIATQGEVAARTLRSWNKLLPAREGGWLGFLAGNRNKLIALAVAYGLYAAALRRGLRAWDAWRD